MLKAPEQGTFARFQDTRWSLVLAAGNGHSSSAQAALETLCRCYWPPLYAFVRRRGFSPHEAEDLTQEFFGSLLARRDLSQVHPTAGKFRTFLLACLDHFLNNDWRRRNTLKRGGGQVLIPIDAKEVEASLCSSSALSPERLFDRQWAETVLDRAMSELREELVAQDKGELFDELRVFLSQPVDAAAYDAAATRLGSTPGAVATSLHRLRKRYRDVVRTILAQTVSTPLELEEEMRYLLEVCA